MRKPIDNRESQAGLAERAGRGTARDRVLAEVESAVTPILDRLGLELDRVEFGQGPRRPLLRVFIDRRGGLDVDHCAQVSRELSAVLDGEDVVPGSYVLEVSSPGLTRPLRDERDFRRHEGRLARVNARVPVVGRRREVTGILLGVEQDAVVLEERRSGEVVRVPLEQVATARLELE